jgi:hypothetical protein
MISFSLYQTTGSVRPVPVRIPLIIRKGIRRNRQEIKKMPRNCFS